MSKPGLRIALAQLNLVVGDLEGNVRRISEAMETACEAQAALLVTPELAITGYPPQDLLFHSRFLADAEAALARLISRVKGIDLVVGHPERHGHGEGLYNSASWIRDGEVIARYRKQVLPNYGVFDEKRYFCEGQGTCVVNKAGARVGISICEDAWVEQGPLLATARAGAELLLNLNASPYDYTKIHRRERELGARARETGLPIAYINLVGGQDELVFDGASFVVSADGAVVERLSAFETRVFQSDWSREGGKLYPPRVGVLPAAGLEENVFRALTTGIRDYVDKNGFPGVIVGLSGGIDSAVTLCLAKVALGRGRTEAVFMPSRHTAEISGEDSRKLATNLGIPLGELPIDAVHQAFIEILSQELPLDPRGTAVENLQARVRGALLMAISNEKDLMVLATGNKSEMSVGYATLYGDMAGGFSALKDVPKTLVYRLARYINQEREVIPQRVIERPPSAELAPDQKDSDSLPPYPLLDAILYAYVEENCTLEDIVGRGFEPELVRDILNRVENNEYKRRQAPPGVRISPRGFGTDRRYPITNRHRF